MVRRSRELVVGAVAFLVAASVGPWCLPVFGQDAAIARASADAALRSGDFARAAKELAISANAGDPEAQFRLAGLYRSGRGVAQDDASAFKWIRAAAVQGHLEAQVQLGVLYQTGRGVGRDDKEARLWLAKAAERGSELAAKLLAKPHSDGGAASSRSSDSEEDGWRTTTVAAPHTSMQLKPSAGSAMVGLHSWMLHGGGRMMPFVR